MSKEFQYELSNVDMKNLYRELLCYYESFPEILVFENLEDGSDIICRLMSNGRYIFYIKNNPDMESKLFAELETPSCNCYPAFSFEYHRMDGESVAKWIACACEISDILQVRCPQITFTQEDDAGNFAGVGLIILPDSYMDIEMFVAIAHELRHEWQHNHHPEWKDDYVQAESEEDLDKYLNHPAEIDAEAYARKLAGMFFGIDLFKGMEKSLLDKLLKRASEIEIEIDDEKYEYINYLLFGDDEEYEE